MDENTRYNAVRELADLRRELRNFPVSHDLSWFQKRRFERITKKVATLQQRLDTLGGLAEAKMVTLDNRLSQDQLMSSTFSPSGEFAAMGLTDPQLYFVYSRIEEETTIEDLCKSTGLDSGTASEIVGELAQNGLVELSDVDFKQ